MSTDPQKTGEPEADRLENKARWRFFAINLVRLGGVFFVILGIMMMLQKVSWARSENARYVGFVISILGMFTYAVLTRMLVRRWASPRDRT